MADLASTMRHARTKFADAPVAQRSPVPPPAAPPEVDVTDRLKGLDLDQLEQVAEALGRQVDDDADEEAVRRSLVDYVEEWADDMAEEGEDDPEAARAAGRQEAIALIEELIEEATDGVTESGD